MTRRPQDNMELIRQVLNDDYLNLRIEKLVIEEDFLKERCKVRVETVGGDSGQIVVNGEGVGFVDALIKGLFDRYAQEYESLKTIEIASFSVKADVDTTKKDSSGADAVGEITISVRNSAQKVFEFADSSRSIVASAARAVIAAVEYFVNAERAFIILHKARSDAKQRNRADLVGRYTRELSELVSSTSYASVIDQIQKEIS